MIKMSQLAITLLLSALVTLQSSAIFAAGHDSQQARETEVVWRPDVDTREFWLQYANSKGGLTWGESAEYPEYDRVKEGDTLLIVLPQGTCLMEFFHSRWRRANDVRRWHPSVNEVGGCPYVFD